jgi:hypothetical protein
MPAPEQVRRNTPSRMRTRRAPAEPKPAAAVLTTVDSARPRMVSADEADAGTA